MVGNIVKDTIFIYFIVVKQFQAINTNKTIALSSTPTKLTIIINTAIELQDVQIFPYMRRNKY